MDLELKVADLRREVEPGALPVESTEHLEKLKGIIGQERAVRALQFGLQVVGRGYNTFVAGPPGIGKMTSVRSFLEEIARTKPTPPDWCYVHNFDNPYEPTALKLDPGKGVEFKKDMENLVEHMDKDLPQAFESEEYVTQKEEKLKEINKKREEITADISKHASEKGFLLQSTPMGVMIIPKEDEGILKGKSVAQLTEEEKSAITALENEIQKEIKVGQKRMRQLMSAELEKVKKFDRQVVLHSVGGMIEDLHEKYDAYAEVKKYLDAVQHDILENIDMFKDSRQQSGMDNPFFSAEDRRALLREQTFSKYRVNVLVDNSSQQGAPVVIELNPTYYNLIGRIEKEMRFGALTTDFTLIKAGAILRALGGFLVVPVEDTLLKPGSWDALKRTICSGEIRIEDLGEQLGFMSIKTLRPQAIPFDVKIVLVGQSLLYYLLYWYDSEFRELFKVKADFDTRMDWTEQNMQNLLQFVHSYCDKEKLKHLDRYAVADLLEHAARLAEDKEKLTTNFGQLADLIREAHYWASQVDAPSISAPHVQKAIEEKVFRSNLIQERIQEWINRGIILIDMEGSMAGQVNGLSVIQLGDYEFGRPSRITATVHAGREGVVDIEREVQMGGPIHSKGVLILTGYLTKKYSAGRPLTLSARLVFEQSYEGIEGDSASSTELYAILSALSGLPIRQGIAVTGSVNQNGEVQAIGGVNDKIEGFFEVCRVKGLTGNQGVIIPASNVQNLMLKPEVVEAVKEGKFKIWAVKSIDQGIEVLTGVPAGEMEDGGEYPEKSVNGLVIKKLREFEQTLIELRERTNGHEKEKK